MQVIRKSVDIDYTFRKEHTVAMPSFFSEKWYSIKKMYRGSFGLFAYLQNNFLSVIILPFLQNYIMLLPNYVCLPLG